MPGAASDIWAAYRLRLKRRRLIWRSIRSRRNLTAVTSRTDRIRPGQVLAFSTIRNEAVRLPYFLTHYRSLGVGHFFFVLNDCDDGSEALLAEQPDVSIWRTGASYKASRFGVDWITWLQFRYGHGAWCLTVDADELLIYPHHDRRPLFELTQHLDEVGRTAFGALMLDLFPKGRVDQHEYEPGQDPTKVLNWFDAAPYRAVRQKPAKNLWVQGGTRDRAFFADQPERAPTLNKLPLMKWNRRFAYMNSTHSLLPPKLNLEWDGPNVVSGNDQLSGVLLHTKFLPGTRERALEELQRKQHFGTPDQFETYYDWLASDPDLWHSGATAYTGWQQLEELGLLSRGGWD